MKRIMNDAIHIGSVGTALLILLAISGLPASAHRIDQHTVTVSLKHTPFGTTTLNWSAQTQALTVNIALTGLQANTRHPAHIHEAGTDATEGPVLYTLNDVVADAAGNGTSTTVINNVANGIPATGWSVNVHSGPTLATAAEALVITTGNITNGQASMGADQLVNVSLNAANAANQDSTGYAYLTLDQNTLTVKATVNNLVPGSSHAFHIHAGSCESQLPGTVLYTLTPLTADATGTATSVTTIPNVTAIPATGWYLNVHFNTDLATQTGFDPISCGNVVA